VALDHLEHAIHSRYVASPATCTVVVREAASTRDTLEQITPSSTTFPRARRRASASSGESPSVFVRIPNTSVESGDTSSRM
jgi:hypothetical protein